jgi:hypothetical protein
MDSPGLRPLDERPQLLQPHRPFVAAGEVPDLFGERMQVRPWPVDGNAGREADLRQRIRAGVAPDEKTRLLPSYVAAWKRLVSGAIPQKTGTVNARFMQERRRPDNRF